ncbi:hypothetical protein SUGI_0631660 [Cryptomeria japonica]|nr:hypothetical protein SUGI_0631660 [Cryptomeria japonica]
MWKNTREISLGRSSRCARYIKKDCIFKLKILQRIPEGIEEKGEVKEIVNLGIESALAIKSWGFRQYKYSISQQIKGNVELFTRECLKIRIT